MFTGQVDEQAWLVADIGGTNARFAVLDAPGRDPEHERVLACADYPDLIQATEAYLAGLPRQRPARAAMAIANPVTGDRVRMTNHHWAFSIEETRQALGLRALHMVNDLTAQALAVRHLPAESLLSLGGGPGVENAPLAILGPGTGLGVSGLIPCGGHWEPLHGEGGHVSFSPVSDREIGVLQVMHREHDHVSVERLASGMGLVNLYRCLAILDGAVPELLKPADITRRAADHACPHCVEAVRMFCGILGNITGNLILTLGARGGFYICGGIVPRLGDLFDVDYFRERMEAHGRFRPYLAEIPGYVVLAPHPALLGLSRGITVRADTS
ncbi:MAG: glucokinase [Aquisalimonadaceae bacterium]